MKQLKEFNIPFVGLKEGNHLFEYQINNTFFEAYNFEDFNNSNIKVTLDFEKKSSLMQLYFKAKGTVNVPCDVTGELFDLQIEDTLDLLIKFGATFNDENEEILILPQEAYQVNVVQYIYELIVLAVPQKRVQPSVLNNTVETQVLKTKETKETKEIKETVENKKTTDPRWDKLKDLLTDK